MFARLTVLLFCVFLLLGGREPPWADANVAYQTTQAIVDRGALSIQLSAPAYFFVERNGKKYGFASLGTAISQIPSYLAFRALRKLPGLAPGPWYAMASHLSSALWMSLAIALFARRAQRIGATATQAVALAFVLQLGTLCLVYGRSSYGEALQAFLLTWFVDLTLLASEQKRKKTLLLCGLCVGMLLHAKLVYGAVLPVGLGVFLWAHRKDGLWANLRALGLPLCGALPGIALLLVHNWVKTGHPLRTGYQSGQLGLFDGDLLSGLFGLLLSPGRGLVFYAPPLLLGVLGIHRAWQTERRLTVLVGLTAAVVTLISAKYPVWHGGYCYGPRYLVPLIPMLLWLSVPWLSSLGQHQARRAGWIVALVGALGLWVNGLGSALYWDHYCRVLASVQRQALVPGWSEDHHAFGYFVPQFSPIRGHFWLLRHTLRGDLDLPRDAPWLSVLGRPVDLREEAARLRVDFWALDWLTGAQWTHKRYGFGLLGMLLAGMFWSARGLGARLRWDDRQTAAARYGERAGGDQP